MTPTKDDVGSSINTKTRSGSESFTETSLEWDFGRSKSHKARETTQEANAFAPLANVHEYLGDEMSKGRSSAGPRIDFSPDRHKLIPANRARTIDVVFIRRELFGLRPKPPRVTQAVFAARCD